MYKCLTAKMSEQSEVAVKEAGALPLMVTYFSSGDTVFINFELEEHHCSEQDSLFVDFVTEIVDAATDQNTEKLLQLLEPSSKVWGKLRELNKKRNRWGDHDDEIVAKVRKRCAVLEDIFVHLESQRKIRFVDVRISDEIDPSGKLRKRIKETKLVDSSDSYLPEEEDQANSCYHTTQMEMAAILKKRIKTIMRHYHGIDELSRAFDDVDFVVYTARYKMLSDQTEKRICHPHAGVLSKEELEARHEGNVKKRMFMYVGSVEKDEHLEQLKREIQGKPRTLFIIILDECPWEITKDKDQTPSAHNLFINEWCNEKSPRNVLVLQISATPFNLLTQNSRLPEVKCFLLSEEISTTKKNYEAGDLLVLESESDLNEDVKETSKEVELHIVHWSEIELKNLEDGVRMKLKSTLSVGDVPYIFIRVSLEGNLDVTFNEREATDFIVQGNHGIVTIKPLVRTGKLLTMTRDENGNLHARSDPPEPAYFEVKLDFGVGVAAFSLQDKGGLYLAVDEYGMVHLRPVKLEKKCGVSIIKPKRDLAQVSFLFYTDRCWPVKVGEDGKQYLSLNYHLSTLNCKHNKVQSIRGDMEFQNMVKKAKREGMISTTSIADAMLCAEYCYYVFHVSAFDCDDKIRQVLSNDNNNSPTSQFTKALAMFIRKLEKSQEEEFERVKKSIKAETFKLVCDEIRGREKKDFTLNLKERQRSDRVKTDFWADLKERRRNDDMMYIGDEAMLAESFVACLMHHSEEELRNVIEETQTTSIIEKIKKMLRENDCQKMVEIWKILVQKSETNSLVLNLIQSGQHEFGKMKAVRANNMETADQFYNTLKFAQEMCDLQECFEIIKDYDGIQIKDQLVTSNPFFKRLQTENCQAKMHCLCKNLELKPRQKKCVNCGHVHKSITQYEDLENLACLIILVDKDRTGDTFPRSFDCLDLRLSYDRKPLYLSTFLQELGRICRYEKISVDASRAQNLPYVLIGPELYSALKESVNRSPSVMSLISHNRKAYKASKDSYDHENQRTYCNRILLQAEPQIGKTGAYLCLIKLLRLDILGKEKVLSARNKGDQGTFYLLKENDPSPEKFLVTEIEGKQNWQFPYWKTIQNLVSLNGKVVAPGKYSFQGRFYTHDTEENPFSLMEPRRSAHGYQKVKYEADFRAFQWHHFWDCSECRLLIKAEEPILDTIEVVMDGAPITVTCSLPFRFQQDRNLREQLKSRGFNIEGRHDNSFLAATNSAPTLPYWIFHPSHRDDPRKCLFNYHHVMQENNHVATFMQVAVVQRAKFEAYRSTWGKILAIFQLPDELPNCDCRADEGGVGYYRLFIQKMAYGLDLEYVFVIDDNVATMREAQFRFGEETRFSATVLRHEDGKMKMQRCSFLKPLVYLQKITEGKVNPPNDGEEYEPHPLKEQFKAQNCPLYSYTGPAKLFGDKGHDSYGVLGLLRSVPTVRRPFSKTQVCALVLLNVRSTVEKGVFYRPWPCWEDLRFNDDCDKAGLWVVRCNRYCFYKLQYQDWINSLALPGIYQWNEESKLEERPLESELPKDLEESVILKHLRNLVDAEGHGYCFKGQIEDTGPEDGHNDTEGTVDMAGGGVCPSANFPVGILEQLEIEKYVRKSSGVPVLILSYDYSSTLPFESLFMLNESYCSTTEKIVFVVSAKQLQEARNRIDGLTLADVRRGYFFHVFSKEMSKKNGDVAIFSAADPGRHSLRWIVIEVSFSKQELREENNGSTASEGSSAKQPTIESPESGVSRNPGEGNEIDQTGTKRSAERDVEDLQQNMRPLTEDQREHPNVPRVNSNSKKVAVGKEMTPKVKKDDKISQDSKPGRRKRSPYSETATSKRPRVEGYVRDGPTTSRSTDEQIYVTHVTPGLCTNALGKPTELLSGAVQGSSGRDMKTSSKESEFVRSPVTGLTPDDPAYDEGTNTVTATIVKLWREKVKQGGDKDLAKETVEKALVFEPIALEGLDGNGYNALTKACSLPSVGIRLVSHLLNIKKMDVNSQIPYSFNLDSPAAIWLTPGMSALSVAIRRGNIRCIPTFMQRETDFKRTDRDQNTALHHCVLSSVFLKTAFKRLFRCYRVLEWKKMKNVQNKSPLDIAKEKWMESHTNNDEKKKEDFKHVLKEMGHTVPIVNVTDDDDDGDDDEDDDDEDDDDNDGKEDDEDNDSEDDKDDDDGTSSDSNDDDDSDDKQDVHGDGKVVGEDTSDEGKRIIIRIMKSPTGIGQVFLDTREKGLDGNRLDSTPTGNSDGIDDSEENMDNNDDDDDNDNGDSNDDDDDNHEHEEKNGDDNNSYNDTESDDVDSNDNDSNDNADNSDEDMDSKNEDNYDAHINIDDDDDDIDDWWRRQQRRLAKHWRV
ncbi:uncharacterized protein [Acropora muricata]|uniref:uncharacterized protein n=1 Tax=Acropora muricata TaxID=159855 RepID=UPI0034E44C9C